MADPVTLGGLLLTAILALGSAAISYGTSRQKVNDLADRVDDQDRRIEKLASAVEKVGETKGAVDVLGETIRNFSDRTDAGHALLLSKIEGFDRLFTERLDNLRDQVQRPAAHRAARSRTPHS